MTSTNPLTHNARDVVELLVAFRDAEGEFVDPPAVTVEITSPPPASNLTVLEYGTHSAIERGEFSDDAGQLFNYRCSIQPSELEADAPYGFWRYVFVGLDPATAVESRVAGEESGVFQVIR